MIAKPSIAFNDFSGTAKDVTARNVNGRNILSVRAFQNKVVTPAQATTRNQLSKISREYKQLSDSQMQSWEVLAKHLKGISTFGKAADFLELIVNLSLFSRKFVCYDMTISWIQIYSINNFLSFRNTYMIIIQV